MEGLVVFRRNKYFKVRMVSLKIPMKKSGLAEK